MNVGSVKTSEGLNASDVGQRCLVVVSPQINNPFRYLQCIPKVRVPQSPAHGLLGRLDLSDRPPSHPVDIVVLHYVFEMDIIGVFIVGKTALNDE